MSFSSPLWRGAILTILLFLAGCASAPLDYPKVPSTAIESASSTREAREVARWMQGHTDTNGFYPLANGLDAFGSRLALISNAEVSIDAQYFLMKPDNAGLVFAGKLLEAADRGVRVRLLLDDIFTTVDDVDLAMLDNHPNIELRVFNPIARKGIYLFNYLGHFSTTNRRMHNKSLTIDNVVSVVGGRNIAVEYYQLETTGEFMDFDILTVGPIVQEISASFDDYWNHQLAVPMAALFDARDKTEVEQRRIQLNQNMATAGESIYAESIHTPLMEKLAAQSVRPYVANAQLLVDPPQKLLEEISVKHQVLAQEVRKALAEAESEIVIFTPYFIPGKKGLEFINELRAKGIRIVVVTNSLGTNNHTPVHSAYSSYRKDLLKAGVELWEARPDAAKVTLEDGSVALEKLTLHTKGILIDRKRVFAGSLNLDPRSIDINTEMGLLIDSTELAALLAANSIEKVPKIAYKLELDSKNKLSWHATIDGQHVVETKEPQTTAWRRFIAWIMKIAPEGQL